MVFQYSIRCQHVTRWLSHQTPTIIFLCVVFTEFSRTIYMLPLKFRLFSYLLYYYGNKRNIFVLNLEVQFMEVHSDIFFPNCFCTYCVVFFGGKKIIPIRDRIIFIFKYCVKKKFKSVT